MSVFLLTISACGCWLLLLWLTVDSNLVAFDILFPAAVGCMVIWAAVLDWFTFRLRHFLTLPAAGIAILGNGLWGYGWSYALGGAALGFALLKACQILCRRKYKKECIGSGDCLLMLSLGAFVGPELVPWCPMAAVLMALTVSHCTRSERLPFGPFLVAGTLFPFIALHG